LIYSFQCKDNVFHDISVCVLHKIQGKVFHGIDKSVFHNIAVEIKIGVEAEDAHKLSRFGIFGCGFSNGV